MEQKKTGSWKYLLLAFMIPFGGMLLVMLIGKCMPFGTNSMMFADMVDQYYPFFLELRRAVRSGEVNRLLYTWNVGMGQDFLGLISYYLMSPLYLIGVLIPDGLVMAFYCLLMPIKLGFAGMFFAYMLKCLFNENLFGGGTSLAGSMACVPG